MATIHISDNIDLNADLKIRDDSPLAKAGLTKLVTTAKELFADFNKPIDEADEESFALGGTFTSPSLLSSDVSSLTASAGINCQLSIVKSTDGFLFPDDGFSPIIPIDSNQAWLGIEFDLTGTANVGTSVNGVGIYFEGTATVSCSSFLLFTSAAPPLPLLRDACAAALGNFSIATGAAPLRSQPVNTVNVAELSGSITVAVALEVPFNLNALASATLPFNKTVSIQPTVTLQLSPSIEIAGDLLVRSYKMSDSVLRLGVYKKRGTTIAVSLTAGAGIEGDFGSTDVLGALLNKALPGVDVTAAGITGSNADVLNGVIKDGLDRSLSAQMNATCSASHTDEAAVLYEIHLDDGDLTATDEALGLALHGDWRGLGKIGNARRLRNIAVETVDKQRSITVNLFGFYSAISVEEYLKSCTVLVDESGQMSIIDKVDASRIGASTSPFAADTEKLRKALIEDFLCTATYAVVAGKLNMELAVTQSYLDYKREMQRDEMLADILLGYELNLIPKGSLDASLKEDSTFQHACVSGVVNYDMPAMLSIFYKDATALTPRSKQELEQVGRSAMCALLNPADDTDAVRTSILKDDAAWAQMDEIGNVAAFRTIPDLSHLGTTQLAVVQSDWTSIVWWADSVSRIAPALQAVMAALSDASTADATQDQSFMKARIRLANLLGDVTRNSSAAFMHGWGEAVMFRLSGGRAVARMDIDWNSKSHHFGPPADS